MPEALETGEYKVGGTAEFDDLEPCYVVAYSGDSVPNLTNHSTSVPINQGATSVNGIYSCVCFIFTTNYTWFSELMEGLQEEAYSSYVVSTFTVPKFALQGGMQNAYLYPRFS